MSRRHTPTSQGVTALDTIYARYEADPVFQSLRATSNFVPGEGDADSPHLLLVGEAPGATEDQLRRPFVGDAGKILDELFVHAKQHRANSWLTNLVKYRPPGNDFSQVTAVALRAADYYLVEEVDAVKPTRIALMGNKALQSVFPAKRIGSCHGKILNRGGRQFVALYHPAVVLPGRSPNLLPTLKSDFESAFLPF